LREKVNTRLQAVFFSTTASALTTLATGEWPCRHGITGWWTYLPDKDICTVPLPFTDRATEQSLTELGLAAPELFPVPSIWPQLACTATSFLPGAVATSIYSQYAGGGTPTQSYEDLPQAVQAVEQHLAVARERSFTYLYLPQYDGLVHRLGTYHEEVFQLIRQIDTLLGDLAARLPESVRMVISADHGLVDVPQERCFWLSETDPLHALLRTAPSGERAAPIFHVKAGHRADFAREFQGRFADDLALLTSREVEDLQLLGPQKWSPVTRQRMGDFLGIAAKPVQILAATNHDVPHWLAGIHGGLTPDEMYVPLILA
jgi:hypothetical protein